LTRCSGEWRGTFQPSDIDAWFASFTAFIVHDARLAQTNSVEMLCFGTEFVQVERLGQSRALDRRDPRHPFGR
jgi:Glycoside Hydrolase Family 113